MNWQSKSILVLISAFAVFLARGQDREYILKIRKASSPINIDGVLDEAAWTDADIADRFYMITPIDTGYAETKTEVMVTYDETKFYLAAICYDDLPGDYITESLRRDFSFGSNDNFLVFIDPFNDKTNGFSFGSSAAGAQWDGLLSDGGASGADLEWDNKWESKVTSHDDHWIFEMAVPFKTLRYKRGVDSWGINFSRMDLKRNEKSSWYPVPRQFPSSSMAFVGRMEWEEAPPAAGSNISIIPYALGGASKNFETGESTDYTLDAGVDAKVAVSSSLNLDLTVNPNFSQVEVDRQRTNLDRFELFFPERRQFFLENSDLFANFGFEEARPFFSRRIGLESPIIGGARLSGKINRDWRVGLMNITTSKEDSISLPAQNYTVAALQRRVFARSNISALFVNRQALNFSDMSFENTDVDRKEYNRMAGLDYNLASANNRWVGKIMLHKTFTPGVTGKDFAHGANINYNTETLEVQWSHQIVGENYNAEVGFVPRTGYYKIEPRVTYNWYPNSTVVNYHGPSYRATMFWNASGELTDSEHSFWYFTRLLNTSSAWVSLRDTYIVLQEPFDPTNSGGEELPAGSSYRWNRVAAEYNSDRRKVFNYEIQGQYGGYFNGTRLRFRGIFTYRYQPFGSIGLDYSINDIRLPEPYSDATLWLIGPRIDITFTDAIFWTTFIQYNNQINNVNINSRFQWRFAPVSDFFLVYTDNYYSDTFFAKNRAIVAKLSYWFNL